MKIVKSWLPPFIFWFWISQNKGLLFVHSPAFVSWYLADGGQVCNLTRAKAYTKNHSQWYYHAISHVITIFNFINITATEKILYTDFSESSFSRWSFPHFIVSYLLAFLTHGCLHFLSTLVGAWLQGAAPNPLQGLYVKPSFPASVIRGLACCCSRARGKYMINNGRLYKGSLTQACRCVHPEQKYKFLCNRTREGLYDNVIHL